MAERPMNRYFRTDIPLVVGMMQKGISLLRPVDSGSVVNRSPRCR